MRKPMSVDEAIAAGMLAPRGQPEPPAGARATHPDPALPGLGRQLAGFARSAAAVTLSGFRRAPEALRLARLAVCQAARGLPPESIADGHCDRYRTTDGRCGSMTGCGCYLDGQTGKAAWAATKCPLGRWPRRAACLDGEMEWDESRP